MKKIRIRKDFQTVFFFIYAFYVSGSILFFESNLGASYAVGRYQKLVNFATLGALLVFYALVIIKRELISCKATLRVFFLLTVLLTGAMIIVKVKNGGFILLLLIIMAPVVIDLDFRSLLKLDVRLKAGWLVAIIAMYEVGFLQGVSGFYNETYKQALGYHHPNTLGIYAYSIIIELLVIYYDKIKVKHFILAFGLGLLTMYISGARTTTYTFFVVLLIFIIAKWFPKLVYSKPSMLFLELITPALLAVSIVLTKLYEQKNSFAVMLNEQLSYRLEYQRVYMKLFPPKLFGQRIFDDSVKVMGKSETILDSAYILCLLYYGIVFTVLLCLMYSLTFRRMLKQERIEYVMIGLFFVCIGFAESSMLKSFLNVSLMSLFYSEKFSLKEFFACLISGKPYRGFSRKGISLR